MHTHTHVAWPGAIWFAVKQMALTFGRGGHGQRRLSNCWVSSVVLRSPLLRKSFQGDVLFSLVLRATLLFKQHPGKARHKKHISSILSLSWCVKAGRQASRREGGRGMDECVSSSVATRVCVEAVRPERMGERARSTNSVLSGY